MTTILHTFWRMSLQACILIPIVFLARKLLRKYSGFYTRLLWLLVMVRLLCPVLIESDFSLLPEFPSLQTAEGIGDSANDVFPDISSSSARSNLDTPASNALISAFLAGNRLAANLPANHSLQQAPENTPAQPPSILHAADPVLSDKNAPAPLYSAQGADTSLPALPSQSMISPKAPEKTASPAPDTPAAPGKNSPFQSGVLSRLSWLLPALYLLGVITAALVFFIQFLRLKRRISTAVRESGNVWLCENTASPFVIGLLRPRIILPYHMDAQAKEHVLSHEQTHIRHCDPLLHFAGTACLCLHWWNPFVWLAVHKMNQDMELYCDESTLRRASYPQRKSYAKTLLSFAEQQSIGHIGPAFGESNTERRVKNIMQKRKKNLLVFGLVALLAIFCAAAFMTIPKTAKNKDEIQGGGTDGENGDNSSPDAANHIVFSIDPLSVIQYASLFIPDFQSEQDMDAAFWKNYLLSTFANAIDLEAASIYTIETVTRYSEQHGSDITYNKVMMYDLDALTKKFFGKTLSELGLEPESLADGNDILYEDGVYGAYYIAVSDSYSPDYTFGLAQESSAPDNKTILVFPKYQNDMDSPISQITLYLQPAENEYGYILTGKEEKMADDAGVKNNAAAFSITGSDISFLQQSAVFMPDFAGEEDLDAAFWKDYLFYCCTQRSELEKVSRYSERRGMTTAYAKISAETLDDEIRMLFGKPLSEYVNNPQDLTEQNGDIAYEDGCYYIRIPAGASYDFDETAFAVSPDGQSAELTFFKRLKNHSYPESKITLSLKASETQSSYILTGREETEYNFTFRTLTGNWVVTDYFIPSNAPADRILQEEIETLLGVPVRFGPDYLKAGSRIYPVDGYRKESVSAADFENQFPLSGGKDLITAPAGFDYYTLQTEGETPFGSAIYRYDFENALVLYEGVLFRITWLTDALDEETIFDESTDLVFALPDENGFVEGPIIPPVMQPGSILYYTDDVHYIIIEGGIALDTPQKVEEFNAARNTGAIEIIRSGAKTDLSVQRSSDGLILTYEMYGSLSHLYPRSFPREKLEDGFLNWLCENEFCRAAAAGLDGAQPKVYYQKSGGNWEIYPLPGFENLTDEERNSLVLTADAQKISVAVTKGTETIVKEIDVEP